MIPWNPIHRYAGMTSLFDSIDDAAPDDVAVTPVETASAPAEPLRERTPLGFVDVRAAASFSPGPSAVDEPSYERPPVEVVASSAGERVPFYKREIGFRRSQPPEPAETFAEAAHEPPAEPAVDPTEHAEPVAAEPAPEPHPVAVPWDEQPVARDEPVLEATVSEPDAEPFEADLVEVASLEPEREPEPPAVSAPAREPVEAPSVQAAPVAPAKVPLHKRELSFGRNGKSKPAARRARNGRRNGHRVVGLKIGASQLAAAVVQESEGRSELVELARTPLEPGIVLDGEVRNADALTEALRAFFADQKLPTRDVRIGLASNRIGVRTFDIAGIDDETRFDNAVRFKAHEVLPIAPTDSVLDYRVLEERTTEAGEPSRRILLVVAPRDQVTPYVEVAERAGLRLAGIDLEALGLLRAFVDPGVRKRAGDTATVVVAIGHETSTLLVSGGGVCEFTRVFQWGGQTLQDAIQQELQIHPAEAATVLRHLSLTGASRRIEGVAEEAKNRALEAVRLRLTPFARELVASLQFYQTQAESLGIGEILITGGTSQLDGLAEALHQMIGVQVRVGDPLQRLAVRRGAESGFEQSLGSLAVAIGLAIEDDPARSVDLTPRDVKTARKRRPDLVAVLLPVAAVVPLAAAGFLFAQAHGKVSDRQSELSSLQQQLDRLPQPRGPQIDASLRGEQAARASAVAQVLGGRHAWDGMLADFSRVLPADVWLTELKAETPSVTAPTPASASTATAAVAAAPAGSVTISGYTYTQADVARLLARLSTLPSLAGVQLQQSATVSVGGKDVVQFTILGTMREAGGSS